MGNRRIFCYTCNRSFNIRQLGRMDRDQNNIKRQIAIARRDELGHPPLNLDNNSRLCVNCNRLIINEIAMIKADPMCLRLNVLAQTASQSCIVCNVQDNIVRLTIQCRVNIFVERNIYVPENVRSCAHHLNDRGYFFNIILLGLHYINRPYIIKGPQLNIFLQQLRYVCVNKSKGIDENQLTDEEFQCIAPINKEQFENLLTYCDPVLLNGKIRCVKRKDLLAFLCKMRQGLSDDFLKIIFGYSSRQNVSIVISYVRLSLMQRFVPINIGLTSISRQEFIETCNRVRQCIVQS